MSDHLSGFIITKLDSNTHIFYPERMQIESGLGDIMTLAEKGGDEAHNKESLIKIFSEK